MYFIWTCYSSILCGRIFVQVQYFGNKLKCKSFYMLKCLISCLFYNPFKNENYFYNTVCLFQWNQNMACKLVWWISLAMLNMALSFVCYNGYLGMWCCIHISLRELYNQIEWSSVWAAPSRGIPFLSSKSFFMGIWSILPSVHFSITQSFLDL